MDRTDTAPESLGPRQHSITVTVVVAVAVWWTFPTQAKQRYQGTSIDTFGMMTTATNLLPEVQCDQGTIFLPDGVHY